MYDAIVIGGSFAGLSAAMQLARGRARVLVVDGGEPRNRFSPHSHGFFAMDGMEPSAMLEAAREKLRAYPTVSFARGKVEQARGALDDFTLTLGGGELRARRLVLAYGVRDQLPELPGLRERWGISVLHCPYCHGYEYADRKLGVLAMSPMSPHQGILISGWGPTTLFLDGQPEPDAELLAKLDARGVTIERARVQRLEGEGTALGGVLLEGGRRVDLEALYIAPRIVQGSALGEQLGCALEDGPMGPLLRADERRQTTVPGVFAAGDIARALANASVAAADGVVAGAFAHQSLIFQ